MAHRIPVIALCVSVLAPAYAAAQGQDVIGPVKPIVFNGDLRNLPKASLQGEREIDDRKRPPVDPAWLEVPQAPDPVVQRTMPENQGGLILGANFNGLGFTGLRPPDTVGAIGPLRYLQMVNTVIGIYDLSGTLLAGPVSISSIWSAGGFSGPCASQNAGDPVVIYDRLAGRFVISQFHTGPNGICVAVSQTTDPIAGGWFLYDFSGLPSFPDYFKIGVWPNAYYIGANASQNRMIALQRSAMITGAAATAIVRTVTAPGVHAMLMPATVDGVTPPASNAPGILYRHVDDAVGGGVDRVELFEFLPDFVTPANSTVSGPNAIPVAAFGSLCGFSFSCVFQPGTAQRVDSVTEWPMWRLAYRNFTTHESMVVNNAVDTGGGTRAGVRWYELRRTPPGAGAWTVFQQGTFAPGAVTENRWMASVAMDNSGNIAIGYNYDDSSAGTPVPPSLRLTGRMASDPPGQMTQPEVTMHLGTNVQTNSNRWGDYSALTLDPLDECTFWFTGEHMLAANQWATRIGSFQVPACVPLPVALRSFEVE